MGRDWRRKGGNVGDGANSDARNQTPGPEWLACDRCRALRLELREAYLWQELLGVWRPRICGDCYDYLKSRSSEHFRVDGYRALP